MSVFCPKCDKKTYDEYTCDFCRHEIKKFEAKENYILASKVPNHKMTFNPQMLIVSVLLAVIATTGGYLAYDKYQERQQIRQFMVLVYGEDDADTMLSHPEKVEEIASKHMKKNLEKYQEEAVKSMSSLLSKLQ